MVTTVPEFNAKAVNIYRTKSYIIKQEISIQIHKVENSMLLSRDTYYERNSKRDAEYEKAFKNRKYINGLRLPSTTYTKKYVY